jgi:hypothetical protein
MTFPADPDKLGRAVWQTVGIGSTIGGIHNVMRLDRPPGADADDG